MGLEPVTFLVTLQDVLPPELSANKNAELHSPALSIL